MHTAQSSEERVKALEKQLKEAQKKLEEGFRCPITLQIMAEPYVAGDGQTYEKEGIEKVISGDGISPVTRENLKGKPLVVNNNKKNEIHDYLSSHPNLYEEDEVYLPEAWKKQLVGTMRNDQVSTLRTLLERDPRLLTLGFGVEYSGLSQPYTVFHLACELGSPKSVELVLEFLQKKNKLDAVLVKPQGFIPRHLNILLQEALEKRDRERASLLLRLGGDLEQPDNLRDTLLHRMVVQGNHEAVAWLLEQELALESVNAEGNTALLLAVSRNHLEITRLLLKKGAKTKVDALNQNQDTPLHLAASQGSDEVVSLLLEAGANHELENIQGQTPSQVAKSKGYRGTAILILQKVRELNQAKFECIAQQFKRLQALEEEIKAERSKHALEVENLKKTIENQEARLVEMESRLRPIESLAPALIFLQDKGPGLREKAFLKCVVEGEQDQAEALLKKTPNLALVRGDVTDLSKRVFKGITGFQYAIWALDFHMWTMIRGYMSEEAIREQVQGLESGSWIREHGTSVSWLTLISALDRYIELFKASKRDEIRTQWQKQVGGAQRLLPAHVVNEYCHPTRPFEPCPNFLEEVSLPRSRATADGEWFTATFDYGKLGETFAVSRNSFAKPHSCPLLYGFGQAADTGEARATQDREACHTLLVTRTQQRDRLLAQYSQQNRPSKPRY